MSRITEAIRFLQMAFYSTGTHRTEQEVEDAKSKSDLAIVSRLSSGNIRLQRGKYATREDLEKQYERVRTLTFGE